MTSSDVAGAKSAGDPAANEAVGGAAGAAPVPAQEALQQGAPAGVPAPELEDEGISLPTQVSDADSGNADEAGERGEHGDAAPDSERPNRGDRLRSFEIEAHPEPHRKIEEWRFTPLARFEQFFSVPEGGADLDATADRGALSVQVQLPEGVEPSPGLGTAEAPRGQVLIPEDRPAALASAHTPTAPHVRAAKNTEYSEPFRIEYTGSSAQSPAYSHLVIEAEESSSATVIVNHVGSAQLAQNVEIVVGDNAQLTVISLQDWDDDAVHIATHHFRLGRDARLKHIAVSLGGHAVRVNVIGEFSEPGAEIENLGLYFADENQFLEHRLFTDHAAPQCTSNTTYKGALQGKNARSVWVGDVLIRKEAEGTDTYELNRNLVLTDGARADSVPNLEIETGEIEGAGHAAATGRFDDEQLFYLRARGISEIEARRLVVRGFFAELIQQIDVPEIRDHLFASIETELARSMN